MPHQRQVPLDDVAFDEIRRIAHGHRLTIAEWVRQALRSAPRAEAVAPRKLRVLRHAGRHACPTGEIADVLDEIEAGRFGGHGRTSLHTANSR